MEKKRPQLETGKPCDDRGEGRGSRLLYRAFQILTPRPTPSRFYQLSRQHVHCPSICLPHALHSRSNENASQILTVVTWQF